MLLYILLSNIARRHTGKILARGFNSMDRAERGPYRKDKGPLILLSQYGHDQAWVMKDLLNY